MELLGQRRVRSDIREKKKPSPSQTWFGVMMAFLLLFTLGFVAVLG